MAQYDDSIRINAEFDTKEAKKELKNLKSSIEETAEKITLLRSKMDALKDVRIPTQEYKEIQAQIEKTKNKIKNVEEQQEKFLATGGDKFSMVFLRMQYDLDRLRSSLPEFESGLQQLVDTGNAFTLGKDTEQYAQMSRDMERLNARMSSDTQRQTGLQSALAAEEQRIADIKTNASASSKRVIKMLERRKQLTEKLKDMDKAGVGYGYKDYEDMQEELSKIDKKLDKYKNNLGKIPKLFSRMKDFAKIAFKVIRSGLSFVGKMGIKAFTAFGSFAKMTFSGLGTIAKKAFSGISGFLKNTVGSFLGFEGISSQIKKGFENFEGYSDQYAQSLQNMRGAMTTLGNQCAAAFVPLAQTVVPWITQFTNVLSAAMSHVTQFIAALSGKSSFTKAKKAQDDYNKSLGGTAKAADKARGALAGFDSLDVLETNQDAGQEEDSSGEMFEEGPIENSVVNLADTLKEFAYGEDWLGMGAYISQNLNAGLQEIYDFLSWDSFGPQITYFVTAFTNTLNGLVSGFNWNLLGNTIGAGINIVVNTLGLLTTGIDWESLGGGLSEGINGLVNEVDFTNIGNLIGAQLMILPMILLGFVTELHWGEVGTEIGDALNGVVSSMNLSEIGQALGSGLTGMFQGAIDFSKTFNWEGLGNNISGGINGFFEKFDGAKLAQSATSLLGGLLDTLIQTISTIDWAQIWRDIIDFLVNVDWLELIGKILTAAGELIFGIFEGLVQAIVETDWGAVWDSIVKSFKDFFGIHSPSTLMEDQGNFLMEGLFGGVSALVEKVVSVFTDIKEKILEVWEKVKSKTEEIWNGIKDTIKGPINAILEFIEFLVNGAIDGINGIIEKLESFATIRNPFTGKVVWSLDLPEVPRVSLPRLATGAVIRGGNPFMAILGDQPAGHTNIEAPLSTIEQAVENVMGRSGYGRESVPVTINLNYDGETFARLSISNILSELGRQGYNVDMLGVT